MRLFDTIYCIYLVQRRENTTEEKEFVVKIKLSPLAPCVHRTPLISVMCPTLFWSVFHMASLILLQKQTTLLAWFCWLADLSCRSCWILCFYEGWEGNTLKHFFVFFFVLSVQGSKVLDLHTMFPLKNWLNSEYVGLSAQPASEIWRCTPGGTVNAKAQPVYCADVSGLHTFLIRPVSPL